MEKSGLSKRPWGWMFKFIHTKRFWVKFLRVKGRTSDQSHKYRDEYFVGVFKVKKGERHRLGHGFFFELATGNPKEEDIKRYEDDYNR